MRKHILMLVIAVLLGQWGSPVWAITLGFQPSTQTVTVGSNFDLDLIVSGLEAGSLDEIVSAFALDVNYGSSLVQATGVDYSAKLGVIGAEAFPDIPNIATPGLVSLLNSSVLSDAALAALQSDSFVLATIHFSALAAGSSPLTYANTSELVGRNAINLTFGILPVQIQVVQATSVPEPDTLLLMGAGMMGFLFRRRSRQ
jgi:hypothetical protein